MSVASENLSWVATPTRALLKLAWPIAVSTVSYSVMTLVDTFFVGHLGADSLAGVGLAGMIAFAIAIFGLGFSRGVKTLISQAMGAGTTSEVGAFRAAGLAASGVLSVAALVAGALVMWWLQSQHDPLHSLALLHFRVRIWSVPALLVCSVFNESRQGQGDSRGPMWATLAANIANILFNALFVGTLKWGVSGSAIATVISQHIALVWLVALHRQEPLLVPFSREQALLLIRMGAPTGVQFLLEIGAFSILTFIATAFGSVQMAAHQIAIQTIHFSFLPMLAVAEAAAILSGNAVGASRSDLVTVVAKRALLIACAYGLTCGAACALFGTAIARVFTSDVAVIAMCARLLLIAAAFQIFDGVSIVARCVLRGVGDVRYAAVVGVVTAWCMTPPLAWLLGIHFGYGVVGAWAGLCAEIMVGSMILGTRMISGRWMDIAQKSRESVLLAERA